MKLSWGIKITVLYACFVALILTLVILAMRQRVDLVAKDYYEQELKFQNKIERTNRSRVLKEPLTWEIKKGSSLVLIIPRFLEGKKITGTVYFFRPSDATMDKTIEWKSNGGLPVNISTQKMTAGWYKMQIDWKADKDEYYDEGIIYIN